MAHERAGQLARPEDLIDIAEVVTAYYTCLLYTSDAADDIALV